MAFDTLFSNFRWLVIDRFVNYRLFPNLWSKRNSFELFAGTNSDGKDLEIKRHSFRQNGHCRTTSKKLFLTNASCCIFDQHCGFRIEVELFHVFQFRYKNATRTPFSVLIEMASKSTAASKNNVSFQSRRISKSSKAEGRQLFIIDFKNWRPWEAVLWEATLADKGQRQGGSYC